MPFKKTSSQEEQSGIDLSDCSSDSDYGELTREEYLERNYWTLQFYFEELVKDDSALAAKWLQWAVDIWRKNF